MASKTYDFSAWESYSTYIQYSDTHFAKQEGTGSYAYANVGNTLLGGNTYSGAVIWFGAQDLPSNAVITGARFYYHFFQEGSGSLARSNYRIAVYRNSSWVDLASSGTRNSPTQATWQETIDIPGLTRADLNNQIRVTQFFENRVTAARQHRLYRVYLTVEYTVPATALSLSPDTLSMSIGGSPVQLALTKTPENTTDSISWTSSNTAVATVTGAGLVSPKAAGAAVITAKAESGVTATCAVTVSETVTVTHSPTINGNISPGAGTYNKSSVVQFVFSANPGHILESVIIGGETVTEFNDPSQYSREITLISNITLGVTAIPKTPVAIQAHTREKISDKPGYEKSVVTYSSDMDYVAYEIRRTAAGAERGRGIGELLDSGTINVTAEIEKVFEAYYYHLETDGDYVASVYVKNAYGIWSG